MSDFQAGTLHPTSEEASLSPEHGLLLGRTTWIFLLRSALKATYFH